MKVKVYCMVPQSLEVEVDDKFAKASSDEWYFSHREEGSKLLDELDATLSEKLPEETLIISVYDENDNWFYDN